MEKRSSVWVMGLYWIPFVVGLASACTYAFFLADRWGSIDTGLRVTLVLGMVIGVLAVVEAIFAAADVRALAESKRHQEWLEERLAAARNQTRQLSSHVEVLTAMREVTRILSDAVDLKLLLEIPEPVRIERLTRREGTRFDRAWNARWASAEAWYFANAMLPAAFDLVLRPRE